MESRGRQRRPALLPLPLRSARGSARITGSITVAHAYAVLDTFPVTMPVPGDVSREPLFGEDRTGEVHHGTGRQRAARPPVRGQQYRARLAKARHVPGGWLDAGFVLSPALSGV